MPDGRTTRRAGVAFVGAREPGTDALLSKLPDDIRRLDGPAERVAGALDGAAALVYAASARATDPRAPADLDDAHTVLAAAVAAGVPRIVVLSSTEVLPPSHHHLGLVSEARAQYRPGGNRWSDGWRALEELAAEVVGQGAGSRLSVLRAAPVPVPGGRDFFSRLLGRRLAPTVPGFDPSIQLLAPEDLAEALSRVLSDGRSSSPRGAPGVAPGDGPGGGPPEVYHAVPRGTAPLHRAIRIAGGHRLAVPRWLQRLGRRSVGWTRRVHAPERVDFLRYPWTAAGERAAAELGFAPRFSTAEVARRLRCGTSSTAAGRALRPASEPSWEWAGEDSLPFDDFGMDRDYVARYGRTLFRFLHDLYWRVEVRGLEHVPRAGRGVLTGTHRGFMPFDGVMALHLLVREAGRYPRFLLHPTLTKFPFLANFMTKLGGIMACRENADWVLERDGLVGIYPEGIRGAFTPYRRAYRLGKFGRDEYVRMALANRAPIIPFVTVGSAEIFPILGRIDWGWWKRYSEWPYLPITPTFPLLPVPLPSKWHTRILEPLPVQERHGPEAAEDPEVVGEISRQVRRRMEAAIGEMLERRRSIFFGSVFDGPDGDGEEAAEGRGGADDSVV